MLRFEQTSLSSSRAIWKSLSSRSRLDSSAGISSAAASRSAGLPERTRFRCSSMSSRIVNSSSPTPGIQRSFHNWLENRGGLPKMYGRSACLGGITSDRILFLSQRKRWEQNSALPALTVVGAGA